MIGRCCLAPSCTSPSNSELNGHQVKVLNSAEGYALAMRTRVAWLVGVCLLLTAGHRPVAASDSADERASLTGLTKDQRGRRNASGDRRTNGLTTETLQTDVEGRLKRAGIALVADSDAYLYVHVTVADPGSSLPLPFFVDVSLMQEVTLPRGVKHADADSGANLESQSPGHGQRTTVCARRSPTASMSSWTSSSARISRSMRSERRMMVRKTLRAADRMLARPWRAGCPGLRDRPP